MVFFSKEEIEFLEKNEVCRIATCDKNGNPHVTPVCYIFKDNALYIFTDYGTKKLKNIYENPKVSVVIDVYRSPWNKAVIINGEAEVIEKGEEYKTIYEIFYRKFSWVRRDPWNEGEAPLIKVKPLKKVSWGLKKVTR